jgi:hypothetical protein
LSALDVGNGQPNALRRHSDPMPIAVPNYNRKTDRH